MNSKLLNRERLLKQVLPSLFFIVVALHFITLGAIQSSWSVVIIAVSFIALLLSNVFLQTKIIGRFLGIIFLLASCYMMMAIFDDVADGEATWGYLVGVFLFLSSIVMSVLLIVGYKKSLTEIEECHTIDKNYVTQ